MRGDDRPEWDFITLTILAFFGFCLLVILLANVPIPTCPTPILALEVRNV